MVLVIALAGCGGHAAQSPEQTARAWSAALNRNDNETAAKLFAPNAEVIQNGELVLANHRAALDWTRALPCGGRIVRVDQRGGGKVLVVFRLQKRPQHACDGPGQDAAAIFEVQHGRIVLWHQVQVPRQAPTVTGVIA